MDQQKLPNAVLVLVLGIASILTCWVYGILGLILGGIALAISVSATNMYKSDPEIYSDYELLKVGKILSIIGIVLNLLFICLIIWMISIIGLDALGDEELARERLEDYFNQ